MAYRGSILTEYIKLYLIGLALGILFAFCTFLSLWVRSRVTSELAKHISLLSFLLQPILFLVVAKTITDLVTFTEIDRSTVQTTLIVFFTVFLAGSVAVCIRKFFWKTPK
jgi:hypothetical protein